MSKFDQQLKAAEKKRVSGTVFYLVAIGIALLLVIIFLGLTKTKINIKPIEQSYQASVSTTSGLSFYVGGSLYAFSDDLVVNVDSGTYSLTSLRAGFGYRCFWRGLGIPLPSQAKVLEQFLCVVLHHSEANFEPVPYSSFGSGQ